MTTLSFVAASTSAMELMGYTVVKLHRGINQVDLAVAGRHGTVVIGHRENFNARSFEVTTVYFSTAEAAGRLDIVGFWDNDAESLYLSTSGGADCLVHDFRLLRSTRGAVPLVVVADRQVRESFVEDSPVSFKFYVLTRNENGVPGTPAYLFKRVETKAAKGSYCDVGVALSRELGLADYRASSQATSNNRLERSGGASSVSQGEGR